MMMSIARRNLAAWRGRLAFSAGGVAVATLLLSFVLALYQGFSDRIAAYVEDVPADVWVVGAGNESFFNPSVILNDPTKIDLNIALVQTGVVEHQEDLLIWSLKLRMGDNSFDSYVIGFDPNGIGGPVGIKKGSGIPGDGEIIIDDVLARQGGVDVGDTILAGDRELEVVGISTGGNLVVTQLSFVSQGEARGLIGITGFVNFVLVRTAPGQEQVVIDAITTNVAGVAAFPREHFADSSKQVLRRNLLPVLLVVLVLAFLVGTVVVGLTVYTAVVEKEREFGVLKAIGTPNSGLVRIVLEQSLVCALLGFVAGLAAAFVAAWGATTLVPQFVTLFRPQDIVMVFILATVMSVIAALVPIQRIARVDPLTVFKA